MKILGKNQASGSYVADLGLVGSYPHSSKVGRLVCIDGVGVTHWYETEINNKGVCKVDEDTQRWLSEIQPTVYIQYMKGRNGTSYVTTTLDPSSGSLEVDFPLSAASYKPVLVWNDRDGYKTETPSLRSACDQLLASRQAS
jgi:hypothetical protein